MSQLIAKIENSMPFMVLGFYTEYLNAWVKTFSTPPANYKKNSSSKVQIKIQHTVKY